MASSSQPSCSMCVFTSFASHWEVWVMMKLPCCQTNSCALDHSSSERLEILKQDFKGAGRGRGNGRFVFQGGLLPPKRILKNDLVPLSLCSCLFSPYCELLQRANLAPSSTQQIKRKNWRLFLFFTAAGASTRQSQLSHCLSVSSWWQQGFLGSRQSWLEFRLCLLSAHRKRLPHFPGIRNMSEVGVNAAFDCGCLYPGWVWALSAAINSNSLHSGSAVGWSCSLTPWSTSTGILEPLITL